jgi:hypothetical protein
MLTSWQGILLSLLHTLSQILTAGIAITAASLFIYALTFNLRDRVARSFALILICVVIVFTADSLGSTTNIQLEVELWLRLQWVGILLIPAAYLHFSDALLETTGKRSRGRRRWAVRLSYLVSCLFLATLPFDTFVGPVVLDQGPVPFLQPTTLTLIFIGFYLGIMGLSWYNLRRSYFRTTNATSRRRMVYLITGAIAPALGSFPFLLFSSGFARLHPILFWLTAFLSNLLIGVLMVVMAYAVAFFGVSWTDRVVKARLFKWLMRGPVTASITLGLVTIVRRVGEVFGVSYTAFVPIVMAVSILLLEHLITLFSPLGERFLFDGSDHTELEMLRELEDRLLTQNDLKQFLEMILAAVRDRLQASGAYVAILNGDGIELIVRMGQTNPATALNSGDYASLVDSFGLPPLPIPWKTDFLIPLSNENGLEHKLVGILGVTGVSQMATDDDLAEELDVLARRASLALQDWQIQKQVFQSLVDLTPRVDLIQALRAAGSYNEKRLSQEELPISENELSQWIKEALTHYWGGPKLTESPLNQFHIVRNMAHDMDGNTANALRAILRDAIDRVKPGGERKYTAEWILYNILEMKFMEGRKVREIALRLSMSEADLYRKQRVAIDAVAKVVLEIENLALKEESAG